MSPPLRLVDDDENCRHGHFRCFLQENDSVWVADITGDDAANAIVTVGFGNCYISGRMVDVQDRLRALVELLSQARARRDDWDLLLPRARRNGLTGPRKWAHPFCDPPRPKPLGAKDED